MRDPVDQFNARGQTLEDKRDVGFFDLLIAAIRIVCNVPDRCSRPAAVRVVRDADLHRDRSRRDREVNFFIKHARIVVAVFNRGANTIRADIFGQSVPNRHVFPAFILFIIGEYDIVARRIFARNSRRILRIVTVDPGLRNLDLQLKLRIGDPIADRDQRSVIRIYPIKIVRAIPLKVFGMRQPEDDFIVADVVIR